MTQDEIIEMAREAGIIHPEMVAKHLVAFANLVAQEVRDRIMFGSRDDWVLAEREACAKLCDELPAPNVYSDSDKGMWDITSLACGDAIRARGEA